MSGGSAPYTFNFLVYNALGSLVFNHVYNGIYPTTNTVSNTVSFTQNSAWGTGTFNANVMVTDSNGLHIGSNVPLSFNAYPALVAGPIYPSSGNVYAGNSIPLAANYVTGGTGPGTYTFQWYEGSSCNTPITGATAPIYDASPSSYTDYTYRVNDSASTPASACSPQATVSVDGTTGSTTTTTTQTTSTSTTVSGPALLETPFSFGNETGYYVYNLSLSNFAILHFTNKTMSLVLNHVFLNGTVLLVVNSQEFSMAKGMPVVVDPSSGYEYFVDISNVNETGDSISFEAYSQPVMGPTQTTVQTTAQTTVVSDVNAQPNTTVQSSTAQSTILQTTDSNVQPGTQTPKHGSLFTAITIAVLAVVAALAIAYTYTQKNRRGHHKFGSVSIVKRRRR